MLDALERGPHRDNTIVILWSDHGWHLGEKQHWQKFTGWRVCTRVPDHPCSRGSDRLPQGTQLGTRCNQPVDLLGLFRTIADLCGIKPPASIGGRSYLPLLQGGEVKWRHPAYTFLGTPGSLAISTETMRYIRYANGDEELYDIVLDPFEWKNLSNHATQMKNLIEFRRLIPTELHSSAD